MVLAAGLGTRMRPLTLLRAKPALPVLNRPLLHWTLEALARQGIREVMINLHHLPATVRRAVGPRPFGLEVSYSFERRILGTGGGPRKVRSFFGDEPALLVNGDVLFEFDLGAFLARHRLSSARASLALLPNPDPSRYGSVVTARDGRILSLAGLPGPALGIECLFTGVHVLDPRLLERLPVGPSDSVRDLYAPMVAAGESPMGIRMRGPWYDLGSPSLYLASHQSMLASGFRGIRRGSLIHPDARVHPKARVVRSVVGAGSEVAEGGDVSGSVLWERVRVGMGARVRESILADGARVGPDQEVEDEIVMRTARVRVGK